MFPAGGLDRNVERLCPVCGTGELKAHCPEANRQCQWRTCARRECAARVDWRTRRAIVDRGTGDAAWETVQIH